MFFVQNSGAKAAGTGMAKSAVILKIKLSEAAAALKSGKVDASGLVTVTTVDSSPQVMNPNGGRDHPSIPMITKRWIQVGRTTRVSS